MGRAIAWTYLHLFASAAVSILIAGIAVRRLGVADFGVFAILAAMASLLNVFEFSLGMAVTRAAALDMASDRQTGNERQELRAAHMSYMILGLGSAALALVISAVAAAAIGEDQRDLSFIVTGLMSALSVCLGTATAALVGVTTGRRAFRDLAIAIILGSLINVAVVIWLSPALGVVSLGLGQLMSVVINRLVLAMVVRRALPWFGLFPQRVPRQDMKKVVVFAAPLLVLSLGGQVINATDLVVVGAVTSAAAAGFYRVGSMIPTMAAQILYRGYDTAFPLLVPAAQTSQEETLSFLTRGAGFIAGAGFGALVTVRSDVISQVVGRPNAAAASVLLFFCLTWLANVPAHGLALVLIARGRQSTFVPLVALEIVANIALTLVLTPQLGPAGAALATLLALSTSNILILPIIVRRELAISSIRLVAVGLGAELLGVMCAISGFTLFSWLHPSLFRIAMVFTGTGVIAAVVGFILLGPHGRSILKSSFKKAVEGPLQVEAPVVPAQLDTNRL